MTVKKLIALFVAVVFVAGMAGSALAQATQTAPKTDQKQDKMAGEKKADKKMASKNANGTVKSASADSLVVAGKEKGKDSEWTFALDPKTKVKKSGKDVSASDLKAGDNVRVRYMEHDGKMVAQTITVSGGGMAKKDEKKPAATTEKK
jgi:Domain of unknown function (DUF5666)